MKKQYVVIIGTIIFLIIIGMISYLSTGGEINNNEKSVTRDSFNTIYSDAVVGCSEDKGRCFTDKISEIINGDTIKISSDDTIRLSLVDAPEIYTELGKESKKYLESICPVGSIVIVDEDDKQLEGSYGRMIAAVYCDTTIETSLNELIIQNGHAKIYEKFCEKSEFGEYFWAKQYEC